MKGNQDRPPIVNKLRSGKRVSAAINDISTHLGKQLSIKEARLLNLAIDSVLTGLLADLVKSNFIKDDALTELLKGEDK